ncbi:hypothetical protein SynROS8604_00228 [Synechococcus sp. ROS8604]|nr:hypothetical protein SynROS8604_00228 [Synechococcus sp. ROS8604]
MRHHVKGYLFAWAFTDLDSRLDFDDQDPTRPLLRAFY